MTRWSLTVNRLLSGRIWRAPARSPKQSPSSSNRTRRVRSVATRAAAPAPPPTPHSPPTIAAATAPPPPLPRPRILRPSRPEVSSQVAAEPPFGRERGGKQYSAQHGG